MANESYWSASGMFYIIIERIFILVIFSISGAHILGDNVRLAWNPDLIPNLADYRLYYGTAPNVHTQKIEVGNFTTVSVPNLIQGQTYFFAVTAYNTAAVESAPSNQVSYTVPSASSGGTLTLPFLLIPSDQTVLRGSTALNDNDNHFVYSGGWALNHWPSYDYLGDEHYSAAAGSTAVLSFTGTQVQLYSTLAHDLGYVEIILDSVPIGFVDAYAPVRTPSKIIYTSPVLPAGPHSIAVRVTGQKNALSSYSYVVVDRANVVAAPGPNSTPAPNPILEIPSDQSVLPGSTLLNDNDSQFAYSGPWALNHWPSYDYLGDEHYSAAAGSTAVLSFTGTQVQLYSTLAHDLGYVEIILDSVPIGFVDAYAPVRTPSKIIYTSPVLPAGPHSIAVRVTGQKNALSSYSYVVVDRANVVAAPGPNSTPAPNPILEIPSDQSVLPGSTLLNDNDSQFAYSGPWALNHWPSYDYLGDEHYSAAAGSNAVLSFTGTQVQLYSTLAHDLGYVEIILDNVPIGFVDAYAPVRTPSKIIYTSPVLPAGPHSITVRVTGQKNALSSHSYAVVDRANVVVTSTPMPSSAAMVSTSVSAPSNYVS